MYYVVIISKGSIEMKTKIFIILLLASSQLFGNTEIFKEVDKLIEDKKYETAFKYLVENQDKIEANELLKKKTELSINYFVKSMLHEMFSFVDIPKEDNIYDYRSKDGSYSSFVFNVEEEFSKLLTEYPDDGELYFWLGQYYYDVLLRYPESWKKTDDEVIDLTIKNYALAISKGFTSEILFASLGHMHLRKGDNPKAEELYTQAIKLNPENPGYSYNMAVAQYSQQKYEAAQKTIKVPMEKYINIYYKSDAYFLAGDVEVNLDNLNKAAEYYDKGKELNPKNYMFYQRLIIVYLAGEKLKDAADNSKAFFNMYPTNPRTMQYLIQQYHSYNKIDALLAITDELLKEHKDNHEALGNLYFHRSVVNDGLKEIKSAIEDLDKANEMFLKVYDEDHGVFAEIGRLKKEYKGELE